MTEAERIDFIRGIRSQTDKLDFLFQALVKTSRLETGVIQLDKKPGRLFRYRGAGHEWYRVCSGEKGNCRVRGLPGRFDRFP